MISLIPGEQVKALNWQNYLIISDCFDLMIFISPYLVLFWPFFTTMDYLATVQVFKAQNTRGA